MNQKKKAGQPPKELPHRLKDEKYCHHPLNRYLRNLKFLPPRSQQCPLLPPPLPPPRLPSRLLAPKPSFLCRGHERQSIPFIADRILFMHTQHATIDFPKPRLEILIPQSGCTWRSPQRARPSGTLPGCVIVSPGSVGGRPGQGLRPDHGRPPTAMFSHPVGMVRPSHPRPAGSATGARPAGHTTGASGRADAGAPGAPVAGGREELEGGFAGLHSGFAGVRGVIEEVTA